MSHGPPINWCLLTVASVLAGILYASWPLGYLLNPAVARHGLGSELEALHQPYNWVFILCDVLSSLLIIGVVVKLWPAIRRAASPLLLKLALFNVVAFGVMTILDTTLPLQCDPSIARCPDYTQDPSLLFHGVFSIGASFCLFVSLVLIWWLDRKFWLLELLIYGYVLFSIFSLVSIIRPGRDSWAQHYSITLCSVWIAAIPYCVRQVGWRPKTVRRKV